MNWPVAGCISSKMMKSFPTYPSARRKKDSRPAWPPESGRRKKRDKACLYAVNLTGAAEHNVAKARKLAKQGAQCFLFNVLSYGYGLLEELREVGIPLMAHPALAGALCGSAETGDELFRGFGSADAPGRRGYRLVPLQLWDGLLRHGGTQSIKEALTWSMGPLLKSFPAPSAGIHPGLVPQILSRLWATM